MTNGTGPFGLERSGTFNFEPNPPSGTVLYLEDVVWRLRAEVDGVTVADTHRARRLYETGHLPVYYFPLEDVRPELLRDSDHTTHCPHKGDAKYWSLDTGARVIPNALWRYPQPIQASPLPPDYAAIYYDTMDRWLEEDDEMFAHPRDPYHRIDVRQSSRRVRILIDGETVAESTRPRLLAETGLPLRYYLPPEDVRRDALRRSGTLTQCANKGEATYFTASLGGREFENIGWSYQNPFTEGQKITGYFCFEGDHVSIDDETNR